MRFRLTILLRLVLGTLVSADYAPRRTVTTTVEVCGCDPTASIVPIQTFTTLTCCPTCSPIPVTNTEQLITSCTTPVSSTTVICTNTGVHEYGNNLYSCSNAPCTFTYPAPCPTCYVCPYTQCWAVGSEFKTKHVQVYEYFEETLLSVCDQEWYIQTSCITKSKTFPSPTIYIENDITIDVTIAPTIVIYTSTSTATITRTVTSSATPKARSTSAHSTWSIGANSSPAGYSGPDSQPPPSSSISTTGTSPPISPSGVSLSLWIVSGNHAGMGIIFFDNTMSYSDSSPAPLRLSEPQLFDSSNNLVYLSLDEFQSNGRSRAYNLPSPPLDALTDIWSMDSNEGLIARVNNTSFKLRRRDGTDLSDYTCADDGYLYFGNVEGTCDVVSVQGIPNISQNNNTTTTSDPPSTSSTGPTGPTGATSPPVSAPISAPASVSSSSPVWYNSSSGSTSPSTISTGSNSTTSDPPSSTVSNSTSTGTGSPPSATPTTFSYTVSSLSIEAGGWTDPDAVSVIQILFTAGNATVANIPLTATVDGGGIRVGSSNVTSSGLIVESSGVGLIYLSFSSSSTGVFTLTLASATQTEQITFTISQPLPIIASMSAIIVDGNSTLDQGDGSIGDSVRQIQVTAYNASSAPVSGVSVTFSCDSINDLCVFSNGTSSITSAITDSNGQFLVSFSSWRGGFKTITFTYENITEEVSLDVLQILNCANSTFASASNDTILYLGIDNQTLIATVVDLNNDPIAGVSVDISGFDENFYYFQQTFSTDNNGQVSIEGQANPPDMWWYASIDGCAGLSLHLLWNYPIDCAASYYISPTNGFTLSESDGLDIEAQFVTMDGVNVSYIAGIYARLGGWHTDGWYYGVDLDNNGVVSYDLSYSGGQALVQNITLSVDDTSPTCVLSVTVTYTP